VAAAIGRSIDIPILIRTLGKTLFQAGHNPGELAISPDLLSYLDAGVGARWAVDQPEAFHFAWWREREEPEEDYYLSISTVRSCLKAYRKFHPRPPPSKPDISQLLNKPTYNWHPGVHDESPNPCTRCRLYRGVALGVRDGLRDLRNVVHACEAANEVERELAVRRVSGFNQLFEAALIKETQVSNYEADAGADADVDADGPFELWKNRKKSLRKSGKSSKANPWKRTVITDVSDRVRNQAREVMQYWVNKPEVKWTSGVDLTLNDLKEMIRFADRADDFEHSAYDESLDTGKMSGKHSPTHKPQEIDSDGAIYSDVANDVVIPRFLEPKEIPVAFSFPPLHHLGRHIPPKNEEGSVRKEKGAGHDEDPRSPDSTSYAWLRPPPKDYVKLPVAQPTANPTLQGGHDIGDDDKMITSDSECGPMLFTDVAFSDGSESEDKSMDMPQTVFVPRDQGDVSQGVDDRTEETVEDVDIIAAPTFLVSESESDGGH
jgi:hypothetical protein